MSELTLPVSIKFSEYKGFTLNVKNLDESFKEFVGLAVGKPSVPVNDPNEVVQLMAIGNSRNEAGQKVKQLVDIYRKNEKQGKLIITS